jgi:hypothetical protein
VKKNLHFVVIFTALTKSRNTSLKELLQYESNPTMRFANFGTSRARAIASVKSVRKKSARSLNINQWQILMAIVM